MTLLAGWLEREMGERALFLGAVEFQFARELRRLPRPGRRTLLSLFRRPRPARSAASSGRSPPPPAPGAYSPRTGAAR